MKKIITLVIAVTTVFGVELDLKSHLHANAATKTALK